MRNERLRIEHEWIEARAEKAKLQSEITRARRNGKTDPEAGPTIELLNRYGLARQRCSVLDSCFFALIGLDRDQKPRIRHA